MNKLGLGLPDLNIHKPDTFVHYIAIRHEATETEGLVPLKRNLLT